MEGAVKTHPTSHVGLAIPMNLLAIPFVSMYMYWHTHSRQFLLPSNSSLVLTDLNVWKANSCPKLITMTIWIQLSEQSKNEFGDLGACSMMSRSVL